MVLEGERKEKELVEIDDDNIMLRIKLCTYVGMVRKLGRVT